MGKVYPGPRNPNWRGGRSLASNGYVLVRVGTDHHLADVRGYAYEHRIVAEEKIGRRLTRHEQVHHLNGDKADNDPANLEVVPGRAEHALRHRRSGKRLRLPDEPNPLAKCACGCGEVFRRFDASGRPRRFIGGHNASGRNPATGQFSAGRLLDGVEHNGFPGVARG
jgi:hypothetical protein